MRLARPIRYLWSRFYLRFIAGCRRRRWSKAGGRWVSREPWWWES